ncbi:hypothetical protein KUCAC02_017001, partial [Chaenocephalus aceratus]
DCRNPLRSVNSWKPPGYVLECVSRYPRTSPACFKLSNFQQDTWNFLLPCGKPALFRPEKTRFGRAFCVQLSCSLRHKPRKNCTSIVWRLQRVIYPPPATGTTGIKHPPAGVSTMSGARDCRWTLLVCVVALSCAYARGQCLSVPSWATQALLSEVIAVTDLAHGRLPPRRLQRSLASESSSPTHIGRQLLLYSKVNEHLKGNAADLPDEQRRRQSL